MGSLGMKVVHVPVMYILDPMGNMRGFDRGCRISCPCVFSVFFLGFLEVRGR